MACTQYSTCVTRTIQSILLLLLQLTVTCSAFPAYGNDFQRLLASDRGFGQNELFHPTPEHVLPQKKPFEIDENINWHQRFVNGSGNGAIRRSSCPAVNTLANRGYINRSGRDITYSDLAHAVRDVYNFGDDNVPSATLLSVATPNSDSSSRRVCLF